MILLQLGAGILLLLFIIVVILTIYTLRKEKEERNIKNIFFPVILIIITSLLIILINYPFKKIILLTGIGFALMFLSVLFFPVRKTYFDNPFVGLCQIDERDIMFARSNYQKGTSQYEDFYQRKPHKKEFDDNIRQMPNLCSPGTITYDPLNASIAQANFRFLEDIQHLTEQRAAVEPMKISPEEASKRIKGIAKYYGAKLVGITELQPYHLYSFRGRKSNVYGEKVNLTHKYAIVFAIEMDYHMVKCAPQIQVVTESSKQYVEGAKIGMQLAYYISQLGYSARNHMDGNYLLVAPLVGADAGLGEISRMGILVTKEYGPRVRLGVVTTDLPLIPNQRVNLKINDFCTICEKCANVCPSQSIPHGEKRDVGGVKRWQINQEECYAFWRKAGTDCAMCINACPFSKPDTFMHKLARYSLINSTVGHKFFLWLDDYFYGKRPFSNSKPDWMK